MDTLLWIHCYGCTYYGLWPCLQAQLGFRPGGHQRLDGKGGEATEPATRAWIEPQP